MFTANLAYGERPMELDRHDRLLQFELLDVSKSPYLDDPTGEIDSTAAVQRAVDDARDHGLVCFFPEGMYVIHEQSLTRQRMVLLWVGAGLDPWPDLADVNWLEAQRPCRRLGPKSEVALLRIHEERIGVLRMPVLAPFLPLGPGSSGPGDLIARLRGIEVEVPIELKGVGQSLRAGLVLGVGVERVRDILPILAQ